MAEIHNFVVFQPPIKVKEEEKPHDAPMTQNTRAATQRSFGDIEDRQTHRSLWSFAMALRLFRLVVPSGAAAWTAVSPVATVRLINNLYTPDEKLICSVGPHVVQTEGQQEHYSCEDHFLLSHWCICSHVCLINVRLIYTCVHVGSEITSWPI